ncbi:MAG: T9SS type A sorting domain-containing protein [Candidatus Delongbacteria bacterium]|nr:T9SS type A sorting domain-containing protein [Candidatus Delongbacteria bacterium]MBN2834742.1 T9SS type A sorting domain-containing protein [Candidatus Delongbacteria bacterium]
MKVVIPLLVIVSFLFAENVIVEKNKNSKLFEYNKKGDVYYVDFNLKEYDIDDIQVDGIDYKKISISGEGETTDEGMPWLSTVSRFLSVPADANVKISIEDASIKTVENFKVYPRESLELINGENVFIKNSSFYEGKGFYPFETAKIGEIVTLRDLNLSAITVNPFKFFPSDNKIEIYENVKIKVEVISNSRSMLNKEYISKAFEPIYESTVMNYDEVVGSVRGYQKPSYLLIYKDDNQVAQTLNYLIDWRNKKGFETHMVSTTVTGTSTSSIKSYIQNAYNTWENPPEYIALAGDVNHIPTSYSGSGEGDQFYSLLSGNDILADAFLGRLSYESITELQIIVIKTLNYEKNPYNQNPDWLTNAVLIGDTSQSGQSCITTNKYIKEMILDNNPHFTFDETYSGSYVNGMANGINNGAGFFNYRGWYGMSGWSNSNINNLNNGQMTPIAVFLTCGTGMFANGESISERFIRVGSSASNYKGAVAAVGTATTETHTCYNNVVCTGIFEGMFNRKIKSVGGALVNGKTWLYLNFPYNQAGAVDDFSYWNNLMGDPALEPWTDTPADITAEFDDTVNSDLASTLITVKDENNQTVSGAYVSIAKGDYLYGIETDANGNAIVLLDQGTSGTYQLTISKNNCRVINDTIEASNTSGIVFTGYEIDDDNSGQSSGNGNMLADTGEIIELSINLKNSNSVSTSAFDAVITGNDEFISVINSTCHYEAISSGSTSSGSTPFIIKLKGEILDNSNLFLNVSFTNQSIIYNVPLSINVKGSDLSYISHDFYPMGIIEPGETKDLSIELSNNGTNSTGSISLNLSSTYTSFLTINDSEGAISDISAGNTASNTVNRFNITASSTLIPGTFVPMILTITGDKVVQKLNFNLVVGSKAVTDPTGPDYYGYYAYDSNDIGYDDVPVYEWIEIAPTQGGSGTVLNLSDPGDDGDIATINLPFQMKMYGQGYSNLTICTNGWVCPGGTEQASYMNWHLPGPLGPSPMIAPFWDDHRTSSTTKICYQYFQQQNYLVVEWYKMQLDYDSSENTFQLIIYDPEFHETSTGDSKLKFQYKVVNNNDAGSYGGYHVNQGEYCSVGIEDHTGLGGMEYSYSNKYTTGSAVLEDEMAIMFTPAPLVHEEAYLVYNKVEIVDNNNGIAESGESVRLRLFLTNIGMQTNQSNTGMVSTNDPYVTIIDENLAYGDIEPSKVVSNGTGGNIIISPNCPDNHTVNMILSKNDQQIEFEFTVSGMRVEIVNTYFKGDDNTLSSGETTEMVLLLKNLGLSTIPNGSLTINPTSSNLTVSNQYIDFTGLESNHIIPLEFNVTLSGNANIGDLYSFNAVVGNGNTELIYGFTGYCGISKEGFESANLNSFAYKVSPFSSWVVDNGDSYEGDYSIVADNQFNKKSKLEMIIDVADESELDILNKNRNLSLSFYKKIVQGLNTSNLNFYIDDELQNSWNSGAAWTNHSFEITQGQHKLTWEFETTGVAQGGLVRLDNIILPPLLSPILTDLELDRNKVDVVSLVNTQINEAITITNTGEEELSYQTTKMYESSTASTTIDEFGYEVLDNSTIGGTNYEWIDISTSNIPVSFTHNCVASGPFDLDFTFSFYGVEYDQFIINPNGWIGFGEDNTDYSNQIIPDPDAPKPAILGYWDDLHPADSQGGAGTVRYFGDSEKMVVWWDQVEHWNTNPGVYDFEIIIFSDGRIKTQYRSMSGNIDSATLGIQNESGTTGLLLSHNQSVNNSYAVEYHPPKDWLEISPTNGIIGSQNSSQIILSLVENNLELGDYFAKIAVTGNIYENMSKFVDFSLHVIENLPYISIGCDSIDMGISNENVFSTQLTITNRGFEELVVDSITFTDSNFSSSFNQMFISSGESQIIDIVFDAANQNGLQQAVGTIYNNSVNFNQKNFYVSAEHIGSVEIDDQLVKEWSLSQNYPNPFNPETTINFAIKDGFSGLVSLSVFNTNGQKVADLLNKNMISGRYSIDFNADRFASGVYYYYLKTKDYSSVKKMVLIK